MIDLKKLSALEKAAKRGPWYAWLKPVHTPDKCITTVPAEQFLREYKEAEKFNAELSERIGHAAVSDEWKNRYLTYDEEVIGCSEWLHAENADLLLIVEMRNQLPDLIAYINRLVAEIERLREKADQQAARISELETDLEKEEYNNEAFMDEISRLVLYIVDLESKIAALKKIAEEERAAMLACAEDLHGIDEGHLIEARRQLSEEHPEVDWK